MPEANIRGLTLYQPWAWTIVYAGKRIENRKWAPPKRQLPPGSLIALHAGLTYDAEGAQWIREHKLADLPQDTTKGAIIGVARFVEEVTAHASPWFFGPFGWVLDDVRPIEPIKWKGALGLWRLPDDLRRTVLERYEAAR